MFEQDPDQQNITNNYSMTTTHVSYPPLSPQFATLFGLEAKNPSPIPFFCFTHDEDLSSLHYIT